jgi:hypothetical protein
MGRRASRRASLADLVEMAKPLLQRAEQECPRKGPGCPPTIPDWVLGVLIMVAVLKRKKSKSAQYRFLEQNRKDLHKWLGTDKFPARSTYFDRYRRAHKLFRVAVQLQGRQALREKVADAQCVAVDKSLVAARGPAWHKSQRIKGLVPRGVDCDSTWSYSEYHGWVQGYGFEVVVTAGKNGVVLPLLAGVDTASVRESRTFLEKVPDLPPQTDKVLADSGYDTNDIGEAIEWTAEGKRTGRRFLCRPIKHGRKSKKPWRETHHRQARRARREARAKYFRTTAAKRLYRRRSTSVEPFNQWLKNLFHLSDQAWHRGLDNNRTQMLAAIFCYQMLVRHNHRHKLKHGQVQWILDGL